MDYTIIHNDEETFVVAYVPGAGLKTARSDHPNFKTIVNALEAPHPHVSEQGPIAEFTALFDPAETIAKHFEKLTERVSVANGRIYLDGDEMHNALTEQVLRVMDDGGEFEPLVNFYEKLAANPNDHSREQAYSWLASHEFTITEDGDVIGYKGVKLVSDAGEHGEHTYESGNAGKATVNGEVFEGRIPNPIGAVVEMPRSEVQHDPSRGCSTGLHVGTFNYAQTFASGGMLEVLINPRDIVSVPSGEDEKMRVCRYTVLDTIDAPHTVAVLHYEGDFEEYCEYCGDITEYCECEYEDLEEALHPTPAEFKVMVERAMRRRRNFVAYANSTGGWTLIRGEDGSEPKHWIVGE